MLKEKYLKIAIIFIVIICSLAIAAGVYFAVTNKQFINEKEESNAEILELENDFNTIFTNETFGTEENLVGMMYNLEVEETGNFNVDVNIPKLNINTDIAKNINDEIYNIFVKKLVSVASTSEAYTIYNIDYVAYVNENILSLVIKCVLKEGSNAQRLIIKTYNYDIEQNVQVSLEDIMNKKGLEKENVEKSIKEKVQAEIELAEGMNIYQRDINNPMYKLENTTEYFVGKNSHLYLIYAYGNNNFTRELDLVIF